MVLFLLFFPSQRFSGGLTRPWLWRVLGMILYLAHAISFDDLLLVFYGV
jgi:hypothetical protein